jgi:hypothetical protein
MIAVRRGYVYLAAAISLEAVTWAVINLLRNLLRAGHQAPVEIMAFLMAAIIVGLPIYLVHWRWAQRLAYRDVEERASVIRRAYLYGLLALFLIPFLANAFDLLAKLFATALGVSPSTTMRSLTEAQTLVHNLAALVVLGPLWLYHWRIVVRDREAVGESGVPALVRRVYVLGFSAFGTILTAAGFVQLLTWVFYQLGSVDLVQTNGTQVVATESARLITGLCVWLPFWGWAQRLARGADAEERGSALRLFYLYASLFVTTVVTMISAALILTGVLRYSMGLPLAGEGRQPLAMAIVAGVIWLFYRQALMADVARVELTARQADLRRLYGYLLAGIGLAAFLVGLGSVLTVIFRVLARDTMGVALKDQLAWSVAALLAGAAIWVPAWWRIQPVAAARDASGVAERAAVLRRAYLYFYLFVATVTVLSSAVLVVARLLMVVLGGAKAPGGSSDMVARALAFGLVGVGVWVYHGLVLRRDGALARQDQADREARLPTLLLAGGDEHLGRALWDALHSALPALPLQPLALTESAAAAMGAPDEPIPLATAATVGEGLARSELVVAPWDVAVTGAAGGAKATEVASELAASPVRKLLVPASSPGWDFAGVESYSSEELVRQVVAALRQIVAGDEVSPARRMGAGTIILGAIGVFLLTFFVAIPIITFIMGSGLETLFGG